MPLPVSSVPPLPRGIAAAADIEQVKDDHFVPQRESQEPAAASRSLKDPPPPPRL